MIATHGKRVTFAIAAAPVVFFLEVGSIAHAPMDVLTLMHIWSVLIALIGSLKIQDKEDMKLGRSV